MKKSNKVIVFTLIGTLIAFFAIIILLNYEYGAFSINSGEIPDNVPYKLSPYYCSSKCKLVSVSNDSKLNVTTTGFISPSESISVSCISEEYYYLNRQNISTKQTSMFLKQNVLVSKMHVA